jgi:energy-coupling factor transporter ATP-binding protein EcfA2
MRYVHRPERPPAILSDPVFKRMRAEYLDFLSIDPRKRAQSKPPDRHLPPAMASPEGPLQRELDKVFDGCCAFCESRGNLRPYRFRPTRDASPTSTRGDDALCYGWLADAWQNLYPICDGCVPIEPNFFPVENRRLPVPDAGTFGDYVSRNDGNWTKPMTAEKAVLLDPCDLRALTGSPHLGARENGRLFGNTPQGKATIKHFNLNRPELISNRRKSIKENSDYIEYYNNVNRKNDDDPTAFPPPPFPGDYDEIQYRGFADLIIKHLAELRRKASRLTSSTSFEDISSATLQVSDGFEPINAQLDQDEPSEQPAEKPLTLARVELTNFKAHEQLSFEMPAKPKKSEYSDRVAKAPAREPALLVIGENAAGKSSILEAIALALSDQSAIEALEIDPKSVLLNPLHMGSTREQAPEARIKLSFAGKGEAVVVRELVITPNGYTFTGEGAFPRVFAYGAYRHFRDKYHGANAAGRPIKSLFYSDDLISNPETWLLKLDQTAFDAVISALREIFGPSGGFEFIERVENPAKPGKQQCLVVTKGIESDAELRTPLSAVSSGFRTILALACDAIRWLMHNRTRKWGRPELNAATGIILIDEVEAHLHPRWKVRIMDGLRQVLPKVTFIVTSHDPLCLRGMDDGEVIVLRRFTGVGASADLPMKVEMLERLPQLSRLTIEQLLKSDFFALFDTDHPTAGADLARLAQALERRDSPKSEDETLKKNDDELLKKFEEEIDAALPVIGDSDVSRLVHEAVALYIKDRMHSSASEWAKLRADTRRKITERLKESLDAPRGSFAG